MLAACPTLAAPDLAAGFKDVCASRAILSDKLKAACLAGNMPRTVKSGSRFDARGIGAELNTLIANLRFILPVCKAEDSVNCRWDAAARGNGVGESFISINGTTIPDRPAFGPENNDN